MELGTSIHKSGLSSEEKESLPKVGDAFSHLEWSSKSVLQTEYDGFDKIPFEETGTSSASAENSSRSIQIHHIEPAENHSSLASVHSSPEPGASGSGQNFQGGQLSNDTFAHEEHENLGLLVLDRTFKEVNSPTIQIKDGIFFFLFLCLHFDQWKPSSAVPKLGSSILSNASPLSFYLKISINRYIPEECI
jgi:hypothetical protein